jgi:hypothetical protein
VVKGQWSHGLRPGANDARHLAPGVYFVRGEGLRTRVVLAQ